MKRITKECQKLGFYRWTHLDVHQLAARLAPKIRGWYYYSRFHKTGMERLFEIINRRIAIGRAFNKYKRFKRRKFVMYAQR